ncbi:MAG: DeoR family transcriptional regulator, partial [Chloroflexota bacterium]
MTDSSGAFEPLFVEERRRFIMDQLRTGGRVSVKELSAALQVSTVTIRQDLRVLEQSGLLERTYGGAMRSDSQVAVPEM